MENNEIYEVSRDEYVGFVNQIKPECRLTETIKENDYNIIKTYSMNTGVHFCTRMVPINEEEKEYYYVFNMPAAEERCAPKPVMKINLETREEVQAFFDILSKLQKGEKING